MLRIFKYQLEITDQQEVLLPEGAEILSVANQNESLCLWALVDDKRALKARTICIVGTGHPVPGYKLLRFIGMAVMMDGRLVWHVFERGE